MSGGTGLLVIDKPVGMTSHDVVARVRRILGTRKVGHAGTLDPMATGVLVIGVEKATRLLGHLALKDKAYSATIRLGASTVTDDVEGEIVQSAPTGALEALRPEAILAGVGALTGAIEQRPTSVSAIKVDGRRSYDRVRAGEQVELAARPVVVTRFDVLAVRAVEGAIDIDVDVECSTGTYIRRPCARPRRRPGGRRAPHPCCGGPGSGPSVSTGHGHLDALEAAGAAALVPLAAVAPECFATWSARRGAGAGRRVRAAHRLARAGFGGGTGGAAGADRRPAGPGDRR